MVVSWVTGMTTRLPAPARSVAEAPGIRTYVGTPQPPPDMRPRMGVSIALAYPSEADLRYRRASVRVTRCADETA